MKDICGGFVIYNQNNLESKSSRISVEGSIEKLVCSNGLNN